MPVTLQLLEKGFPVRAFVRSDDVRARTLAAAGAEIFVGNQYAISDMRRAMTDMSRAYQCAPTAPNGLQFNAIFTAAAHEAKLEHVVNLGQWLSSSDHPSPFTRDVYVSDLLARISPTTTVTSVDPGWFADNYLMVIDMAAHLGLFPMPLGDGTVKKNAPPSNEDIASVVVAALTNPQMHAGKTYRPTGPALMSPNDIAAAMGRGLGRKVVYSDISEKMMVKALRANPPSNFNFAMVSQLAIYADEYRRGAFAVNAPTDHVETVGERTPETFDSIVTRTVAARPDLRRSTGRWIGAMASFARILLTPSLDLRQVQKDRDYVLLNAPAFSQDNGTWRDTHKPGTLLGLS